MLKLLNTNTITLNEGDTIPLSVAKNTNAKLSFKDNKVIFNNAGYFDIKAMVTLTGATIGDYAIQLYSDGSPINGAIARGTIATAGDYLTLTLTDIETIAPNFDDTKANIRLVLVKASGAVSMANANESIIEIR